MNKKQEQEAKAELKLRHKESSAFLDACIAKEQEAKANLIPLATAKPTKIPRRDLVNEVFRQECASDESPNVGRVAEDYLEGDDAYKEVVDTIFMHICGWSMETIINKANEEDDQ